MGTPTYSRSGPPYLIQPEGPMEDVAFVQAKHPLEIQRRQGIDAYDRILESRRELIDNGEHAVDEVLLERRVLPANPECGIHVVGCELNEQLGDVLSRWSNGRVKARWNGHFNHRPCGRDAARSLHASPLDLFPVVLEVDGAAMLRPWPAVAVVGETREARQLVERAIDLERAARVVRPSNVLAVSREALLLPLRFFPGLLRRWVR
mmetsp:Transcript_12725/g.24096  ORF Transcript_12725/g.24096 Transcript_12725/m.24096 type:complete len:206 (+) Transcript_12725:223-840(+)